MNKNKIICVLYMPKTRRWTKLFKRSKKKKVNVCAELYPCWNEYLIEDLKAMPCRKTENFTREIRYHEGKDKVHSKVYDVFKCRGKNTDRVCDTEYTTCENESDLARYEEYYKKNFNDFNKFKEDLAEEIVKYFLSKAAQVVTEKEKESYSNKGIRMLERLRDHSLDLEDIDLFNITKNALNEPRLLILSENFKPEKKKSKVNSLANNVTRSVKRERTSKKSSNSSSSKKTRRARRRSYSNAVK